jgi:putative endonuclease
MAWWYVYLVRCSDKSLYCGTTTNPERRVEQHNGAVGSRYTRSRLPVRLVWSSGPLPKSEAYKEEYRIKRLSKAAKETLVDEGVG